MAAQSATARPPTVPGSFVDDYDSRHTITDTSWTHHPATRYRIARWDSAGRFLIARNGDSTWSRIDWMTLEGMAPWQWAFCIATWDAPSADSAARVTIARPGAPRTGCNGFPFTRMRRAASGGE
jgi:hypothetical protein